MAKTVLEALTSAEAITDRGYTFLNGTLDERRLSYAELVAAVRRRGRQLRKMGYQKGDRIGLVVPENDEFVLTFLGAVSAGIVPVPMYPPLALGKLDSYVDSGARILATAGARALVTTKKVSPILWSMLDLVRSLEDIVVVERFEKAEESGAPPVTVAPEDPCFLQFTSGSTSDPKGVVVTHGSLIANAHAIMFDGLRSTPETDLGVTWLPLYHDMGLIGFVVSPLYAGVPVVFVPTIAFVKRPAVWLESVAKYRGTITFAPNFAFALAAKRGAGQVAAGLDLSSLRVVGCGAEPINAKTLRTFIDTFAPAGLNANAIMPCYGMAEATLAMSFEPLDEPPATATIDREAYENDNVARPVAAGVDGLELVACGHTFPGHDVAIMDEQGRRLDEGKVGEIVFRGPSVAAGYFENAEATAAAIREGWLHTGDLGFMQEGRVYVSGRMKDLIILNGRNYHPQAIEWEAEQVGGIRKGNVVAFACRGDATERLVVVAEMRSKDADRGALADAVKKRVREALGLVVEDTVIVPAGALPKTSSGKLQRRKTRAQYEIGTLARENRTIGDAGGRATLARHITFSMFARIRHRFRRMRSAIPGLAFARPPESASSEGSENEHPSAANGRRP